MRRVVRNQILLVISLLIGSGFAAVPARAQPDPGACNPDTEGVTLDFIEDGYVTKYTCYCVRSGADQHIIDCVWLTPSQLNAYSAVNAVAYDLERQAAGNVSIVRRNPNGGGPFTSTGVVNHATNGRLSNLPAGWLAVANTTWKWSGSAWTKCADSGFAYSSGSWAWMAIGWGWPSVPCGSGYYASNSYAFAWDGGAWRGNPSGVWSGYMYWNACPTCLSPQQAGPTAPPPSQVRAPKPPAKGQVPSLANTSGFEIRGGPAPI
jgi:hypothetical protein